MELQDSETTTSVASFANQIRHALGMAAETIDHDDGSLERTAGESRDLPRWLVDRAYAVALRNLFPATAGSTTARMGLLIAAEQFVERSGRDRFGLESLRAAEAIHSDISSGSSAADADLHLRAFSLSLSFALGHPNSLQMLKDEAELECRMPALWLDLARDHLGVEAFEAKAEEALLTGRMSPNDLLPRLRSIHHRQGPAAAQRLLDAACVTIWERGSKEEADDFINRVSAISPVGWRFTLRPPTESQSEELMPLALYYSQRIFECLQDPTVLYKSITRTFNIFLFNDDDGDKSKAIVREMIISSALKSRDADSYRCIAIIGAACTSQKFSAKWWWADERWGLGLHEQDAGEEKFLRIYDQLGGGQRPQTPDASDNAWRLTRLATACGLGRVQ